MGEDTDPNRLADADQIGVVEPPQPTAAPAGVPTVIVQTAPAPAVRRPPPSFRSPKVTQVAAVERMFPAQDEKIVVYRLRPDGPSDGAYVGTYAASELSGCVTIEQFLDKFVRPRLSDGYGDYVVKMVDALGATKKHSRFTLERPAEGGGGNGHYRDPLMATAADLLRDLAGSRGGATQQQIDELKRLLVAGGQPADANTRMILDRLDTLARSSPKEENVERMLLTKLLKRVEELSDKPAGPSVLPALSMTSPSADPGQIARDVAREFADAFRQQQQPQPQMTMADVVSLVEKMRPAPVPAAPDLMTQLGNVVTLMEKLGGGQRVAALEAKIEKLHEAVTQPNEQPSAIDTIKQVVEVAESLEALGARRVSRTDGSFGSYVRDIFTGIPDVAREIGTLVDKAKQREILATRRLLLQRQVQARTSQPSTQAPQEQPTTQATTQPAAPENPYPNDFGPHLDAIAAADTDVARIKTLFSAFQRLGREPDWKPYYDRTVALLRARDREAVGYANALLLNLSKTGRISDDQRMLIVKAIDRNFDAVVDRLFPSG